MSTAGSAQVVLSEPAPANPPPISAVMVVPQVRPAVAIAANGGWVVAAGTRYEHSSIPSEMREKLQEFTAAGLPIDAVAFTPDGRGWTVVAGTKSWTRNVGGQGQDTYYNMLNAFQRRDRRVLSVAFNPTRWSESHGYVIIWDDGTASYRGIPDEMVAKVREFQTAGIKLRAVAFTGDGGWSLVAHDRAFTRNVGTARQDPNDYYGTLTEWQRDGQQMLAVAFDPRSRDTNRAWTIVSSEISTSRNLPAPLAQAIEAMFWPRATASRPSSVGTSSPGPSAPRATLEARPTTVCAGEEITLRWTTQNADRIELNPSGELVALQGERRQPAGTDSRFTIRAINTTSGQTATAQSSIRINQAPSSVNIARSAQLPTGAPANQFRVATIGDREINRDCGQFTRITQVALTSPSLTSSSSVRIIFEPLQGAARETRFISGKMTTQEFNGMDPRGTWKLIFHPWPETSPPLNFTVTAEQRP